MSKLEEFAFMDALAQADLVKKKEVQPLDLVESAIERIERLNPKLNAVVTPMYDLGRDIAKSNLFQGPFAGVPFLLKDLVAEVAGVRFTEGSKFLKDFISKQDSELVKRLRKAGLIIIGKTNTPEFGSLPTTEPELFGPTRNPWDTDKTPGGSSGGSAAAVAAGMVPMAHGNDGGGSIRMPASCCGVFGLKPTRGRNPLGPLYGDIINGLVVEHALTRSVRDSAALLDATAGAASGDPYWAPPPKRPYIQEVETEPVSLRIAYTTKSARDVTVHEDCVRAAQEAAALCNDLGHAVEEFEFTYDEELMSKCFFTLWCGGSAWVAGHWERRTGRVITQDLVEPLSWDLIQRGRNTNTEKYLLALEDLQRISRKFADFFSRWDVIITPTLAEPPVPLGTFDATAENPLQGFLRSASFMPFTAICNITGQPAMSVPLNWNAAGLPIGTQFMGRFGDEASLFRLAGQLEKARPWASRRPAISA